MVRINSALCMVCYPACDGDGGNVAAKSEGLGPTSCSKNQITLAKSHPGREGWGCILLCLLLLVLDVLLLLSSTVLFLSTYKL